MIKLIRLALGLCNHQWEILKEIHCRDPRNGVTWTEYHMQCKHCGNLKKWGAP